MKILKVPTLLLKWTLVTVLVATSSFSPTGRADIYSPSYDLDYLQALMTTKASEVPVDRHYVFNKYYPVRFYFQKYGADTVIDALGYTPAKGRIERKLDEIATEHSFLYRGLRANLKVGHNYEGETVGGINHRELLTAFILEFAVLYRLAGNGNEKAVLASALAVEEMSYRITKAMKRYPMMNRQKAALLEKLMLFGLELGKESLAGSSDMSWRLAESGVMSTLQSLTRTDIFETRFREAYKGLKELSRGEVVSFFGLSGFVIGGFTTLVAAVFGLVSSDQFLPVFAGTFMASGFLTLKSLTMTTATRNGRPLNGAAHRCHNILAPLDWRGP